MSETLLGVDAILGPSGSIARRIAHYESREGQLRMADAVRTALERRKHLIVEAGTGTGKSFAYLVPAILHVTAREGELERVAAAGSSDDDESDEEAPPRRVVISTHTIHLQEQLIAKDLPLLKAVIPREFTAVLAKGRGNYLSLRRMRSAVSRAMGLFGSQNEQDQLDAIARWARGTADGSRSDLPFKPLVSVWDEVASDSSNCLGRRCETYDKCFYYINRRRVANAQLLVVNHALFFTDLALRQIGNGLLPEYDAVIFDECHTVEAVAGEHLGIQLSSGQIEYTLRKLYNPHRSKGLLVTLGLDQLTKEVFGCFELIDDLVAAAFNYAARFPGGNLRIREPNVFPNRLSDPLNALAKQLERYGNDQKSAGTKADLMSAAGRLRQLADSLKAWLEQSNVGDVYWVEIDEGRTGRRLYLRSAPIDPAASLKKMLFDSGPTVVMTSATIATSNSQDKTAFNFFQSRCGLTKCETLQVGSPFDYRRQVELVLLQDVPDPSTEREAFEQLLPRLIEHFAGLHDGHTFALFTAYQLLRRTAEAMQPWMNKHSLACYSQADGTPRSQLLTAYKENPRGILFGADSFWQGVDVPGDDLRNVMITKLPFAVPDHPLLESRLERIREKGGNPFRDYQLPDSIIRLRQGFGRLVRTARDSGMVVICDPRIHTKSYGRLFLESLPDCRVTYKSARKL